MNNEVCLQGGLPRIYSPVGVAHAVGSNRLNQGPRRLLKGGGGSFQKGAPIVFIIGTLVHLLLPFFSFRFLHSHMYPLNTINDERDNNMNFEHQRQGLSYGVLVGVYSQCRNNAYMNWSVYVILIRKHDKTLIRHTTKVD